MKTMQTIFPGVDYSENIIQILSASGRGMTPDSLYVEYSKTRRTLATTKADFIAQVLAMAKKGDLRAFEGARGQLSVMLPDAAQAANNHEWERYDATGAWLKVPKIHHRKRKAILVSLLSQAQREKSDKKDELDSLDWLPLSQIEIWTHPTMPGVFIRVSSFLAQASQRVKRALVWDYEGVIPARKTMTQIGGQYRQD